MEDNSMDVDVISPQDNVINNNIIENENDNNLNNSDNNNNNNVNDDDEEFGDDNMDLLSEDDINFLMSPQPEKTSNNFSSQTTTSTNLNFNSITNSSSNITSNSNATTTNTSSISNSKNISAFNSSINTKMSMEDNEFNSNLKYYYENLFPFKQYYQWLSYGNVNKEYFPHREFSFTFGNDIYSRFQSFENEKDFKTHLKDYNPRKIDIGAVYNTKPKNKKNLPNNALKPKEKELVFDIDMTDYDDIRTCCTGGDICKKCWTFMTIAIKIMDRALRDDFGFNHILWVYSGRRGVHCWVCDKRARQLSEPARKAIVGYLEVVKGGEQQAKKVNLPNLLHPSLRCAYTIVQEYFPKLILEDMDIFSDKKHYNKLLALVPDEEIRNRLYKSWEDSLNSPNGKWDELIRLVQQKEKKKKELKNFERDTIFQYTYPRLDFNVSLRLNHLLKSPFCIHPGTGRVCVPIDPQNCDNFNPFEVPTLNELVKEINELSQQSENLTPKDYQKNTSIEPYIKQFSNFIKSLNEEINNELRIKKELQERTSFDF